ncbi:substrate-binding and VWA domain-containing protein [Dactylosporangium matsuzakiense]|uniref:VWA domain-containing protein n=1 Tax=Dactylosporangium matsuzakiense TaxID=53360 RepID=A0A9W6KRY4_9ACTN|nr:VWA domain-containing protein [Dactylosporangium matsuzakiense]
MVPARVRRRAPLTAAIVVGVLAVAGTYLWLRPASAPHDGFGGNHDRADCVQIEVSASTEKGDLLAELARQYNDAGRTFGGRCAGVAVHKKTSGAAMESLVTGWDPERDGGPAPQVWAPSSSLWLGLARERASTLDRPAPLAGEPGAEVASIAQSPLAIGMPRPMAEALGWPDKPLGWADVLRLAADPRGWGALGHPEWGRFTLGKDNPHLSTSGLAATVAAYYAASGKSSDLTDADLSRPQTRDFVRGVEASVVHYADDAVKFLANLAEADAQGRATSYVSAVAMQEQLVYLYDSGAPDGDPGRIGKGRRPSVPLVAVHPQDGTLMMDHPYAVLASATAEQQAAAADFLAFLREPAQQQRFADLGFRDYQGRAGPALSAAIGLPGAQPPLSLIDPPAPAVLSHMLTGWDELRKKARVLLVMDVSGSMAEPAGGGRTRLEAAKEAAIQGLARLHPDDEVSLWQFSTEDAGGPQPYAQIVPFAAMRENGERLTAAIKGLHPEGGTALYTTVRAAQRSMLEHYETDRINAIVVLTDGKNEYPRDNDLQALLRDVNADTLERSVRVFAIAFGDKSDLTTLSSIARASRAAAYDARNPSTINDVFISVLSNF